MCERELLKDQIKNKHIIGFCSKHMNKLIFKWGRSNERLRVSFSLCFQNMGWEPENLQSDLISTTS